MPWRGPRYEGEVPSLGLGVLEWFEEMLIVPDGPMAGEPLILTREQAQFVVNLYALDPAARASAIVDGQFKNPRLIRRAVLSRMKGWGKSPLLAALCIIEVLGPVVPDGWDAEGEPVGRSWASLGFKAKAQVVAVSEDQTANTWDPLLEMVREGPVGRAFNIEALETFVTVPRGRIEYTTSSARSREGFRPVFAAMDQTESWTPNIGGPKLAAAIRRNLMKTQGCSVECPNAFVPGEESVAERSYEAWEMQQSGKLKADTGIMLDHREAPPETDIYDDDSLRAGIIAARGDSFWVDPDRAIAEFQDPATAPSAGRQFILNQITSTSDAWITQPEWAARADIGRLVPDASPIVLGFDGSRRRRRGMTDATALIGCTIDGHLFELGVWEQPEGPQGEEWEVPVHEVEAAVDGAFSRWNVLGFYCDPAKWETRVAAWEAKHGGRLKVKASREHPLEWWMTGGRSGLIVRALEQIHSAVVDGELTHDGGYALTRHVLNARLRTSRAGFQIAKEHPDSRRKIDAAVAATLAWQARLDALAKGVGVEAFVPFRAR